jgi:hypothetical protein
VVVLVCGLAAVAAGCGSGVSPTKSAEASLARAFENVQCNGRAISAQTEQKERADYYSLLRRDFKLPRVAVLVSDGHAEDRLKTAIQKATSAPGYKPGTLKTELAALYRLRVKFSADEKALGFRCVIAAQKPIEG